MNVTIAFFTSRVDCKIEWFVDSLARWVPQEERGQIQLLFIDRHLWALTPQAAAACFTRGDLMPLTDPTWHVESRLEKFRQAVAGRFEFLHLPVKPCMWQGPFRLTSKDWFCAAQARNTAIMAAKHPYFVGIDDLSVITATWWPQVKHAASSGYCVCGMYRKVKDLVVKHGAILEMVLFDGGVDSRQPHGSSSGIVPWQGSGLYGCSFGVPLNLALDVNGFDEITDGQSAEDYDFGIRAERAGGKFFLNMNMFTFESEDMHHVEPSLPRESKLVPPDRLPSGYTGNPMSDHVLLNRLMNEQRTQTIAQWTNLRQARAEFIASERAMIPVFPTNDWRDGIQLKDM